MNTGKLVVLIERDPEWRQFVTKVLTRAGYEVHWLKRGIPLTQSEALFLVDNSMVDYVHKLARDNKKFVIFDSAPTISNAVNAYRIGALDYLGKVFKPDLLLDAIREVLNQQVPETSVGLVSQSQWSWSPITQ